MSSQLIELNSLVKNNHGVWVSPNAVSDFDYSDGNNEEQYLIDLFTSTQDLSLDSPELAKAIQDWTSLYHLSPSRANLLKNINLRKSSNILELGCGCGVITRYLAEQKHVVTAVEGSLKRAEIAKLRNHEMNNVEVVCHNFNSLNVQQAHYDAVLFVGVLEYAKRFSGQDDITAEQAVIQLLNQVKAAIRPDGFIVIAIENRTGLKYELGAFEDHLAIPEAGINDYCGYEFTGIKTYDYSQWQNILTECGLANQFYYPFPDYKLPNLVIAGDLEQQDAIYLSTQIQSLDPISNWTMPTPEQRKWLDVIQHDQLAQKSNSFGIIATKEPIDKNELFKNNWHCYDKDQIKPNCRLDIIDEKYINSFANNNIRQVFDNSVEIKKSLLNTWLEDLSLNPGQQTLSTLALDLFRKHQTQEQIDQLTSLDQIMLSTDEQTLHYVKFWQFDSEVSCEQRLFHLLLDFCINHKKQLAKVKDLHLVTLEQIIATCFECFGGSFADFRQQYIQFEQTYRNMVQVSAGSVEQDLQTTISGFDQHDFNYVNSELFFVAEAGLFNPNNVRTLLRKQTSLPQQLYFQELPTTDYCLRFDPCDQAHGNQHYFLINSITMLDNENNVLHEVKLDQCLQTNDLECIDQDKCIFKVIGIDPQIIFSLPQDLKNLTPSYNLAIEIQWLGK